MWSFYFQSQCAEQVGHCSLEICQHSQQLSPSLCWFISPLRTLLSWHSFRKTYIHLTVSMPLGIEAILCLLDVCKALENPTSTGMLYNIQFNNDILHGCFMLCYWLQNKMLASISSAALDCYGKLPCECRNRIKKIIESFNCVKHKFSRCQMFMFRLAYTLFFSYYAVLTR